jgi:hypothetical protein
MAKAKVVFAAYKNEAEKKAAIKEWRRLEQEIESRDAEIATIRGRFVASMGVKDFFEFGLLRVNIQQNWARKINWKKVAVTLARKLFPDVKAFRKWLVGLVQDHPKEATKPYAKLFILKAEGEE